METGSNRFPSGSLIYPLVLPLLDFIPFSLNCKHSEITMSPKLDFKDLVVLVTGAGSGIGKV